MNKILEEIEGLKKSSKEIAMNIMKSSRYEGSFNLSNSKASKTERDEEIKGLGFRMLHVESTDGLGDGMDERK